jgi:hypothetical protein
MDLVTQLITFIADALHVPTATAALIIAGVVGLAQLIGKLIPDTATGSLGVMRKVAKVIGLYVPNNTGIIGK